MAARRGRGKSCLLTFLTAGGIVGLAALVLMGLALLLLWLLPGPAFTTLQGLLGVPTPTRYTTLAPYTVQVPRPTYTPYATATPWPTYTPQATQTAQPTYTPFPSPTATQSITYTMLPTYTPPPTYTPWPTYTPLPTYTPFPTATVTPAPTAGAASSLVVTRKPGRTVPPHSLP